jgi:hypothetical protein
MNAMKSCAPPESSFFIAAISLLCSASRAAASRAMRTFSVSSEASTMMRDSFPPLMIGRTSTARCISSSVNSFSTRSFGTISAISSHISGVVENTTFSQSWNIMNSGSYSGASLKSSSSTCSPSSSSRLNTFFA